jgi:hypothetical protein
LHEVLIFYFTECLLANPGLCPYGTFRLDVRPTLKVTVCTRSFGGRSAVVQTSVDWQLFTERDRLLRGVQNSNSTLSTLK